MQLIIVHLVQDFSVFVQKTEFGKNTTFKMRPISGPEFGTRNAFRIRKKYHLKE